MSLSFILTCPETRQKLWVGQGHHAAEPPREPQLETFYSGESEVMEKLVRFLNETRGKSLVLAVEDFGEHDDGWREFK